MLSVNEIEDYISHNIDGLRPSMLDLEYYRKAIGAEKCQRINRIAVKEILSNAIVFVSDRPNYYFLRLSLFLLQKGIKTVLLSRWGVEKEQEAFFDHIILYDKIVDLRYLTNCSSCIIYVQSWVGWNFLPVYVHLICDQKVACNVNDLTNLLFDEKENLSLIGLSAEDRNIDLLCEKYILEEFSFVTVPYTLEILNCIGSNLNQRFDKNIFYFPCLPSPAFFYQEKRRELSDPVHLLYVGGVPPDSKPDAVFRDQKLNDIVDVLLNSPHQTTILNNPQLARNKKKIRELYPRFIRLTEHNQNFKFKNGFPPWELKNYTKQFHYGLMFYSFDDLLISEKHYQNIIPTKFFTYLEQFLPVIVSDELSAVSRLVKEKNIGIVIKNTDINKFNDILISMNDKYDEFINNIEKYNKRYNIDNTFEEILLYLMEDIDS